MNTFVDGATLVRAALIEGLTPPRRRTVSQWAEERRIVSADSGSPQPGPWSNDLLPHLVEPMDCCSVSDPCTDVVVVGSAQGGKSSIGENFIGYGIDDDPAPMLVVLPTLDEAKKYNRIKLATMIDATPSLRRRVAEQKSRDEAGSTASFKKFRGGFLQIAGANASAGLQMISVRRLLGDEVAEFPDDLDGRGDPWEMAIARTTAWWNRGVKRLMVSTPGVKGACRITAAYEASDQRRLYLPCPSCGEWFLPRFGCMKIERRGGALDAWLQCPAHGCVIEHHHKRAMVRRDGWLKTYPGEGAPGDVVPDGAFEIFRARPSEGRQPGFHFWQVVSPFVTWSQIAMRHEASGGNHLLEKVFSQQVLGEAFEEKGEAPDDEKLFLVSRNGHRLGAVPPGGLVLTGAVDVQGNRLEWAVYAWAGTALTSWIVDAGVIEGDPEADETWKALDAVMARRYALAGGRVYPVELWGIDAGYKSHAVYAYSRGRPRVLATNGLAGHLLPIVGTPKKVDVNWKGKPVKGGALLYPMGTYPLKSLLYAGLRKTLEGPDENGVYPAGMVHLSRDLDRAYLAQLTAEYLADVATRDGRMRKEWKKKRDVANEALDIWVIARAMAFQLGLDRYTADQWRMLAIEREAPPDQPQGDLLAPLAVKPPAPAPVEEAAAPPDDIRAPRDEAPRETQAGSAPRSGWVGARPGWMRRGD